MEKTDRIKELRKLFDKKEISEEVFNKLKDEIINTETKKIPFKTASINWLATLSLIAILLFHSISFIKIVSEAHVNYGDYSDSASAGIRIFYFQTVHGSISLIFTLLTLILSFFRLRFLWVGGIVISVMLLTTLALQGSFTNSYSNSIGSASGHAVTSIIYSPGFFYILFCLLLFFMSMFKLNGNHRPNEISNLSSMFKVFAIVGIIGASLKLIQEVYQAKIYYYIVFKGDLKYYWIPTEGLISNLNANYSTEKSLYCAIIGLFLYGFPLLILVSQIFILLKRKIFIYMYIFPWLFTVLFKVFIEKRFVFLGSSYFGYIMDFFWNTNEYSYTFHLIGTIIFCYLMPLIFFYVFYREIQKMKYA